MTQPKGPSEQVGIGGWSEWGLVMGHEDARCEHSFSQVRDREYRCWKCGAEEPDDD